MCKRLSSWISIIREKAISLSETEGFVFQEVENAFRSQRCAQCGWVRKANRRKKTFRCNLCGFIEDADRNAASNLALDLCEVPYWVRRSGINRKGFYWLPNGLFTDGHEPIVRDAL